MKTLLIALGILLNLGLSQLRADAATYNGYYYYNDERGGRYWQVMADVLYPGSSQKFYCNGAATTQVYFDSAHENRLQAATQAGLAQHDYYSLGSTWRYDAYLSGNVTVGNFPHWFAQPSAQGASYSYMRFWSPQSHQHWQWIHWHTTTFWSKAYAFTNSEDIDLGRSLAVTDYNLFQVLK